MNPNEQQQKTENKQTAPKAPRGARRAGIKEGGKVPSRVGVLVECAMLLALATVLSLVKLIDLPYGGSVTVASAMPMVILAYRHGWRWGLGCGLAWALIQQLTGLSTLSYFTTWQSIVAVILLDYVVAFALVGVSGVFRRWVKNGSVCLMAGGLFFSVLRYLCHTVSGCTVWAGLSIPNEAAIVYSLSYNATYMIPETVILLLVLGYLGAALDLSRPIPARRARAERGRGAFALFAAGGLCLLGGAVADVVLVFSRLQNAESGEFDILGLSRVDWVTVGIVSGACALLAAALFVGGVLWSRRKMAKNG